MNFRLFFVHIDVDVRFEGPPWGSDIWVYGFHFVHVFGEVLGDVFEVRWEWHLVGSILSCLTDPFVQWVIGWECLHPRNSFQDFFAEPELWARESCLVLQCSCWCRSKASCDCSHDEPLDSREFPQLLGRGGCLVFRTVPD